MNNKVGIRYEDRFELERRVAITPALLKQLKEKEGLEFFVEKSEKRIFTDEEFAAAGAEIVDDVRPHTPVIFGVKEMPSGYFEPNKTYIFFSHTIKGQAYNMPLLKEMIEKKINLIDYEKIANDNGQRLIFFGHFAGLAGMINSLWSLGLRLKAKGYDTPFAKLKQAYRYSSLEEVKAVISQIGFEIARDGLPQELNPLVIGFTGYGNVSKGAQEIAALLPLKEISPAELLKLKKQNNPTNVLYKVVFKEKDLAKRIDGSAFELQDYYSHPEKYEGTFEQYIPEITILMNCMYWDARYPKLITKEYLQSKYDENTHSLMVIGDVTCDPGGSIECTYDCTLIEDPVFVYDPKTAKVTKGAGGEGILVMAVDILPSELPRESSEAFSSALAKYVAAIVRADYSKSFDELELPAPMKRALILHNGEFTPDFQYMKEYLK
jgi:alpha-aminoadipic semialdehyde synthase